MEETPPASFNAALEEAKAHTPGRLLTGTLPPECGGDKVSMGTVSTAMEIAAATAANNAGGNTTAMALELTKRGIRKKNGEKFQYGHPDFDAWWESIEVKGRDLLCALFHKRNGSTKDERDNFLKGLEEES